MKSKHFSQLAMAILLTLSIPAASFAKDKKSSKGDPALSAALGSETSSSTSKRMGLGLSSSDEIAGGGAISGIIELDPKNSIQLYFSLPSVSPFSFGVAGIYKHTLQENNNGAGIHIGGGLGLGVVGNSAAAAANAIANALAGTSTSSSTFMLNAIGVGGIHFPIASSDLMVHLDAAAGIHLQGSSVGFGIAPASSALLGMSILYYF